MKSNDVKYFIQKVLNHNVILCRDQEQKKEFILFGKGIGFQKKEGEMPDLSFLEKIYELHDQTNLGDYARLFLNSDEEVIKVSEEIISRFVKRFGTDYSEKLHVSLLDHLNFSLYRYRNKIPVANLFSEDIQAMCRDEYAFAKEMVSYVNQMLNVQLPEEEIGFICMHIYSAIHHDSVSNTQFYMTVINRCLTFIEEKMNLKIAPLGLEKQRLCTHLRFAIKRAQVKTPIHNPLQNSLKTHYPESYQTATALSEMLKQEFDIALPAGEIGYLTLHIQNILVGDTKC